MRMRIGRDKPARGPLDLKLIPGGLIDLEFIAQWAILSGTVADTLIGASTANILDALQSARPELIDRKLAETMRLFTRIVQLNRLGTGSARTVEDLPRGLAERMARAIGQEEIAGIEPEIARRAATVRAAFEELLPLADAKAG